MATKICTHCKEVKSAEEFERYTLLKTGKTYTRGKGKICPSVDNLQYYNLHVDKILEQVICECGSLQYTHNMKRHIETKKHKTFICKNSK